MADQKTLSVSLTSHLGGGARPADPEGPAARFVHRHRLRGQLFRAGIWRGGCSRRGHHQYRRQPVYEPTLKKIRDAIGGDYGSCAWMSAPERSSCTSRRIPTGHRRAAGPSYWAMINGQLGSRRRCLPHAGLYRRITGAQAPFAIQLDIQGLEARALRGAPRALAQHCRRGLRGSRERFRRSTRCWSRRLRSVRPDGQPPHAEHTPGWSNAIYLHRDLRFLSSEKALAAIAEEEDRRAPDQRRDDMLARIDDLLARIKAERTRDRIGDLRSTHGFGAMPVAPEHLGPPRDRATRCASAPRVRDRPELVTRPTATARMSMKISSPSAATPIRGPGIATKGGLLRPRPGAWIPTAAEHLSAHWTAA